MWWGVILIVKTMIYKRNEQKHFAENSASSVPCDPKGVEYLENSNYGNFYF